ADASADVRREPAVGSEVDISVRQERVVVLAEARRPAAGVGRIVKVSGRDASQGIRDALEAVGADDGEGARAGRARPIIPGRVHSQEIAEAVAEAEVARESRAGSARRRGGRDRKSTRLN